MTQLAMDLPENVFSALRLAPREFANEMRNIVDPDFQTID